MKEFAYTKEKEQTIFLFVFVLALTILQILASFSNSKLSVPFHSKIRIGEAASDFDDNLSGNSGISQDYYAKQIEQLLDSSSASN